MCADEQNQWTPVPAWVASFKNKRLLRYQMYVYVRQCISELQLTIYIRLSLNDGFVFSVSPRRLGNVHHLSDSPLR